MINRDLSNEFLRLSELFPVVTLVGPRQSGKTTLCKMLFPDFLYFNLEDVRNREMIAPDAFDFFLRQNQNIILDEVHNMPELFSTIQVFVDEHPERRFILTGSSNFALLEKITQSLAGRTAVLTLLPLSLHELKDFSSDTDTLMFDGGYPAVWSTARTSMDVCRHYYNTYIERDVRKIVNINEISRFQHFMRLCATRVGCEFNASELSNEIGISVKTAQHWLAVLNASYIVAMLPPYYRNIGKRIVKRHKLYFLDTGLACFLLGIENKEQLENHPLRGNIFENMVVIEFLKSRYNLGKEPNVFFYRDSQQKEVDIIQERGFDNLYAFEIKSAKSYHSDFEKNLNYFRNLFKNSVKSTQTLYDGVFELDTPNNGYLNYRNNEAYRG